MTSAQLERIPDYLLRPKTQGCAELIDWLRARGWQMTLYELATERRRRGIPERIGR